jgi:hypothetical protein
MVPARATLTCGATHRLSKKKKKRSKLLYDLAYSESVSASDTTRLDLFYHPQLVAKAAFEIGPTAL